MSEDKKEKEETKNPEKSKDIKHDDELQNELKEWEVESTESAG